MNNKETDSLAILTSMLRRIPGIGKKNAFKMAEYFLTEKVISRDLLHKVQRYVDFTKICRYCQMYSTTDVCSTCHDKERENILCVLTSRRDFYLFEESKIYRGYYFIFHMEDGNNSLDKLRNLLTLNQYHELILGTPLSPEGEGINLLIQETTHTLVPKITVFRCGFPRRSDFNFLDPVTLEYALKERKSI